MVWEQQTNTVAYKLDDKLYCNVINKLQPYKEETMEERQYKELRMPLDDDDKLATEVTIDGNKILSPNGYLIGKITQVDNGMLVEYVKKQPQYPKTYEECCDILDIDVSRDIEHSEHLPFYKDINQYDVGLLRYLRRFRKLLICRDAYWKIAGKQMGLDKPWEPDWNNDETLKYCIIIESDIISKQNFRTMQAAFAFPTEEMRDTFCKNFENLIENCKELL